RREDFDLIRAAAFSPDRATVALWQEHRLSLLDTRAWKIVRQWDSPLDWNHTLAISPDGKFLATGGGGFIAIPGGHQMVGPHGKPKDYAIYLWDSTRELALTTLGKHPRGVTWVTFSPDGRTLASVTWDHTIHLWEKASGQLRARWKTGDNVTSVRFS